jgi:hypothetical protein
METSLKAVFFFVFFHFGLSMLPQGVLIAFTIITYHVDHFCTAFNMVLGQYLPNITLISTVLAVLRAAKNRTRTGQEPDKILVWDGIMSINGFYLSNLYEPGIPRQLMMSGITYIDAKCILHTK